MELDKFGKTLRGLREAAGLTQEALAKKVPVNSFQLISKWERGHKRPGRDSFIRLLKIFGEQLSLEEAQSWALQGGHTLRPADWQRLFPRAPLRPAPLDTLPQPRLFGVSRERAQLHALLAAAEAPWLVALDGIGGIGKTSLANALAVDFRPADRFSEVAWVTAKQEEFRPEIGLQPTGQPTLDVDTLTNSLLEQLDNQIPRSGSPPEKVAILAGLLKKSPYLIVIDNLETVVDYQALLPLLRRLANPTKFLLTSRHSLHAYSDVFCLSLTELSRADAVAFLKYQGQLRGLTSLAQAAPEHLESIYRVVGGNPLALKLIIGQIGVLPLERVLANLKQARGKTVDELYTYIYWQAWQTLDEAGRQMLVTMPLAQNGTFDDLARESELSRAELNRAIEQLTTLSLIEAGGDIDQPRYRIHRLTETFLLEQVIKWQTQ